MLAVPACLFLMPSWALFLALEFRTLQFLFCLDLVTSLAASSLNLAFHRHFAVFTNPMVLREENLSRVRSIKSCFLALFDISLLISILTLLIHLYDKLTIALAYIQAAGYLLLCRLGCLKYQSWNETVPPHYAMFLAMRVTAMDASEFINHIISPMLLSGALNMPFTLVATACQLSTMLVSALIYIGIEFGSTMAARCITHVLTVNFWLQRLMEHASKNLFQSIGHIVITLYDSLISMICLISDNFQSLHSVGYCSHAVAHAEMLQKKSSASLLGDYYHSNLERAIGTLKKAIEHRHAVLSPMAQPFHSILGLPA